MKKKALIALSLYVGLCFIWFFYSQDGSFLPTPSSVVKRVFCDYRVFSFHLLFTVKTMLISLGGAICLSLPLAWLMMKCMWMRLFVQAFLLIFQCLPMFALAPLMILWFGWSHTSVVIPTLLMMVFPLVMNFTKGFSAVPTSYIQLFTLHGATQWDLFFRLKVPYALPFIFAGLRVAVSFAGVGAVGSELAGAQKGLGVFLQECRRDLDVVGVFSSLLCLLAVTLTFYLVLYGLEKILCKEGIRDPV